MTAHPIAKIAKAEGLVSLMGHLLPDDYGKGAPACTPATAEWFMPEEDDPERDEKIVKAKAICAGCPIKASCLAQALRTRAKGVLGGTTAHERGWLRRKQRVSPAVAA